MDPISDARLALVYPGLAQKIQKMAEMFAAEGYVFRVTQGLRTWGEQEQLWQKGRDSSGTVIDRAAVVTQGRGGYSWHNFGLAVDVVPDDASLGGFQADWNISHPVWQRLVSLGVSLGLQSGADWRTFKDWPHFQFTGRFPASPTNEVRNIFRQNGIAAVWEQAFYGNGTASGT